MTRATDTPRHPGENVFNWLAHVQLESALEVAARSHATGRLLDIGCGLKPYRQMFAPYVTDHVGVDHEDSPHAAVSVDVLATAYDIPLDDGGFDTALMSEVLEHLERPQAALEETWRLLAPGGKAIITTPFVWPLHEQPRDFFRFSPHGLRYLLGAAGFEDITVTPVSGQWATVALMSSYALKRSKAARFPRAAASVVGAGQRLARRLDARYLIEQMSWNHIAVGAKPASSV